MGLFSKKSSHSSQNNITGEYLILGESGEVIGDIEAETCSLQGSITGDIKSRSMNVIKGCRIDGKVTTVNLSVESGAIINGEINVEEKDLRLIKNQSQSTEEKNTNMASNMTSTF